MQRRARFDITQWSLVLAAGRLDSPLAREAFATLCEAYWYPLYAFVRREGFSPEDAQDLTQSFFLRLFEKQDLQAVRRERGRFRSFLLAAMKHFLLNEVEHRRALKRGGGKALLPLEFRGAEGRFLREPADPATPETSFDRQWAMTVLGRVLERLRVDAEESGKSLEFEALKGCLTEGIPHGGYRSIGDRLGLSEGAVKVAVHRLRRRYQRALRDEIGGTVLTPDDIDEEIRYLSGALARR